MTAIKLTRKLFSVDISPLFPALFKGHYRHVLVSFMLLKMADGLAQLEEKKKRLTNHGFIGR